MQRQKNASFVTPNRSASPPQSKIQNRQSKMGRCWRLDVLSSLLRTSTDSAGTDSLNGMHTVVKVRGSWNCDIYHRCGARILGQPFAEQAKISATLSRKSRDANSLEIFIFSFPFLTTFKSSHSSRRRFPTPRNLVVGGDYSCAFERRRRKTFTP